VYEAGKAVFSISISISTLKKEHKIMELGMVGLGKMGANMTRRLLQGGHRMVVSDLSEEAVAAAVAAGAVGADSLDDLPNLLSEPRAVWVMVPAGNPTENVITRLSGLLSPGDIIIDGGNSNYKDSMRRAATLQKRGIAFVDAGCERRRVGS
jgi:6-phosphogluconate dehydrogenase